MARQVDKLAQRRYNDKVCNSGKGCVKWHRLGGKDYERYHMNE